jgi:hypothetical protein
MSKNGRQDRSHPVYTLNEEFCFCLTSQVVWKYENQTSYSKICKKYIDFSYIIHFAIVKKLEQWKKYYSKLAGPILIVYLLTSQKHLPKWQVVFRDPSTCIE